MRPPASGAASQRQKAHRPKHKEQLPLRRQTKEPPPNVGPPEDGSADPHSRLSFETFRVSAPCCGKETTVRVGRDGSPLVGCWAHGVEGVADALGIETWQLLNDPVRWLSPYRIGSRREAEPDAIPSSARFAGWHAALLASGLPLAYLTDERGISLDVIGRLEIGWDGKRLMFPMRSGGEIVAYKTRRPRGGVQMRNCPGRGRPWPLYPEPDLGWSILTAGELDALACLSVGLPASSVTLGAGTWREEWTDALQARFVAVAFDNNERPQARKVVRRLREAGIRARRLDLRSLGLKSSKGDVSDYLNGGGSPLALRRLALGRQSNG